MKKIVHITGALKKKNYVIRSKVLILFVNYRCIIALCLAMLQSYFNVAASTRPNEF